MKNLLTILVGHMNEVLHGSGFDRDWTPVESTNRTLVVAGAYHRMGDSGMYEGWLHFKVVVPIDDPEAWRLVFYYGGKRDADRLCLTDYFAETIHEALSQCVLFGGVSNMTVIGIRRIIADKLGVAALRDGHGEQIEEAVQQIVNLIK